MYGMAGPRPSLAAARFHAAATWSSARRHADGAAAPGGGGGVGDSGLSAGRGSSSAVASSVAGTVRRVFCDLSAPGLGAALSSERNVPATGWVDICLLLCS